jgi:hypothetical protein
MDRIRTHHSGGEDVMIAKMLARRPGTFALVFGVWLLMAPRIAAAADTITSSLDRTSADQPADPWATVIQRQVPPSDDDSGTPDGDTSQNDKSGVSAGVDAGLPDPATVDWSILNSTSDPRAASPRRTASNAATATTWSRNDRPDGFSTVTVKQTIMPWWDARVGADLNVAGQPALVVPLPEKLASEIPSQSSGAGWAAATAPGLGPVWDKTSVEARLDPGLDQTKLGTSISKSVPLVDNRATVLVLQGGYSVTDQSALPVIGSNRSPQSSYGADESAKLQFTNTGTSLIAGQSLSPVEDRWLRSIGAEQALFGDVKLTGTVSETPSGLLNRSLTAGFKKTW